MRKFLLFSFDFVYMRFLEHDLIRNHSLDFSLFIGMNSSAGCIQNFHWHYPSESHAKVPSRIFGEDWAVSLGVSLVEERFHRPHTAAGVGLTH